MTNDSGFLSDLLARPWTPDAGSGLRPAGLFVGKGASGVEVAVATASRTPARATLVAAWKARKGRRAAPVLLVVLHSGKAELCGASGESPPVYTDLDPGQVERLCREVLDQPDRHAALRLLSQALPSLETALPGLNNEGLLALHELEAGVPNRSDWVEAKRKAQAALAKRDLELLNALGFSVERLDNLTSILRSGPRRTALAVMLRESESAEAGSTRFNSLSPISYAFKKADDENLPWVVLTQGTRIRLYSTRVDLGVGRRGRTETYVECQPSLLADDHSPYLWLLYSAEALARDGSLRQILEESQRFAGDLAERLRERIYDHVVPELARGIADARGIDRPRPQDLARTYEMALTVLFRLLFIAYAEDRDLLPYRYNDAYRRRSLKQKAQELADAVARDTPIAEGSAHWQETALLWQAVASGNVEWGVPAYDGGLFETDPAVSKTGAALASINLPNECFERALRDLLVIDTPEGVPGPVDFRSLGVREFGTIYEGLLESELAVAEFNLVLKKQKSELVYAPARAGEPPAVSAGEIYLHNRSGARKSSGSYYTKPFAVEHLLNGALEPALDDHFARLAGMDDADATEAFFDFRVADIAMGSGHFLIGAIDRIEKRMADFLASRNLPGVRNELERLRKVALDELGDLRESTTIEDSQLLRRLIARRCIYGVDLNGLSVQLARLAAWIHTFVPGLPLSFLDHNLVQGNALVGVGTIAEIRQAFEKLDLLPLFPLNAKKLLGRAEKPLKRLANINDASLEDIAAAREAAREAHNAIRGTRILCDLVTARSISEDPTVSHFRIDKWEELVDDPDSSDAIQKARDELDSLSGLHFPIAFPEVFLRKRPGFDVVLGNPPWEKARVEEHGFWARHFPGLRSRSQRNQEAERARLRKERPDLVALYENELEETKRVRKALVSAAFPGMGTGDPDLYKAFCWRFWYLSTENEGHIGVVLPRSALAAKGSETFRKTMFDEAVRVDVAMLLNRAGWVFEEAEHRYTIGLVCVTHGTPTEESIYLRGPYTTRSGFDAGMVKEPAAFYSGDVRKWNDSASLPLLPNEKSVEVFAQIRKAPRLDLNVAGEWRARPDRELDATNQKYLMDVESEDCPDGFWPVYKGESFDLWTPDTGKYYAWADPEPVTQWIQSKRLRGARNRRSPHSEFSPEHLRPETLPCFAPRVAFRRISRATDSRTIRVVLISAGVFVTDVAPYLLWPRGGQQEQAYLLGILSSMPLDWYARRFVETHVDFYVFNPLPIPRPEHNSALWRRVVTLAGRLACPDERFATWAETVDVECGPLAADEKDDKIYELDAVVSHLYELKERQVVHIFETFHQGWDYETRLNGVLRHFRAWKNRR